MGCQMDKRETNSYHEMEKKIICKFTFWKNVLRKILFLVSVMKIKTNCLVYVYCLKW